MLTATRPARAAGTVRPRAPRPARPRRAFAPEVRPLEGRRLLSATQDAFAPTDAEQYMLELVNRARANPAAEGRRLVALAQSDPVIAASVQGEDLGAFLRAISGIGPEPPLAFNTRLIEAARDHSAAMLRANTQFHAPAGYLTDPNVARADDGGAYYPTGNRWWATGENVFAYSQNAGGGATAAVDYFEAGFLLDWGNPDRGHLFNLLAPGPGGWAPGGGGHYPYSEVGIGLLTDARPTVPPGPNNPFPADQGLNVGPEIVTQEFGWRSGNPVLTGCFYEDRAGTGFYAPGEGLGGVTVRAVGRQGQGVFVATTWASGGYSLPLPPGTYDVTAAGGGLPAAVSTTVTLGRDNVGWGWGVPSPPAADQPIPGDFAGAGHAGLAVYRPGTSQWIVDGQAAPVAFGGAGIDLPIPGDYDGVGRTQPAVYRPATAQWFVLSSGGGRLVATFGSPRLDAPVPGDYDGVGRTEPAVFRPATGEWFVYGPGGGRKLVSFGGRNLDLPIPGDYDGVGRTEPAVYRPTTGEWFVYGPGGGRRIATLGLPGVDIPVPGDYDGVGHLEPAVYRPTTGEWFILGPNGLRTVTFGQPNVDVPLRVDFDGDGRTDVAVYRPTTGQWFQVSSRTGAVSTRQFGQGGASTPVTTWIGSYATRPLPLPSKTAAAPALPTWGGPAPAAETAGGPPRPAPAVGRPSVEVRYRPRERTPGVNGPTA